jgi:CelD/BcsL family acetyltransferase involved in cellulose biosynthesis
MDRTPAVPDAGVVRVETTAPTAADWAELASRIPPDLPLHLGPGLEAWTQHLLPSRLAGPLRWFVAREASGALIAVLPLIGLRWLGGTVLVLGGCFWPYRGFPAVREHPLLPRAIDGLVSRLSLGLLPRLGVRLGPVRAEDVATRLLLQSLARHGWRIAQQRAGRTFHLRLPATTEQFDAVDTPFRREIDYYTRRIAKAGRVTIRSEQLTRANCATLCRVLGQIERDSWLAVHGDLKFVTPADLAFWQRVCEADGSAEQMIAHILYLDDAPISFSFNIDSRDRRLILANLYAEKVKALSPGWVLARHVLRDAIERRITVIDWGVGDSGYKAKWGATPADPLVEITALAPNVLGWASSLVLRRHLDFVPPALAASSKSASGSGA